MAILDHVSRPQVAHTYPNLLFLYAGDPTDLLHYPQHDFGPLRFRPIIRMSHLIEI
jgi:hypothetical protein